MLKAVVAVAAIFASGAVGFAQSSPANAQADRPAHEPVPVPVPPAHWIPLYDAVDPGLQARLERRINANPTWRRLVERKRLAVGVVDLGDGQGAPRFARINGNQMMYAASLPKIAILLSAYVSFDDGSLAETETAHQDLQNMIRFSSNEAATRTMDAVGMRKIEQVMRDPRFGFYDEALGGGLWVGKRYASTGPRRGDPLFNISHGATVTQVCRFYYQLAEGHLISPERSAQMLEDLSDPGIHHKFVAAIERRAPLARIFRKSGTWQNWHSDSALVRGTDWRNYILVALVESPNGETILRDLVPAAEDVLHPGGADPLTSQL
jgi:beta-lactamase class A